MESDVVTNLGLQAINLANQPELTDAGIGEIAAGCDQLEELCIGNVVQVGSAGIAELAAECGGLRTLCLRNCGGVGDEALVGITKGRPHLASLDLEGCDTITGALFKNPHADLATTALTRLNLAGCLCIRDDVIEGIGASCPLLVMLGLAGTGAGDAGLRAVAAGCPKLAVLDVGGCAFSMGGLGAILAGCPRLVALELAGCVRVTDSWLTACVLLTMKTQIPQCCSFAGPSRYHRRRCCQHPVNPRAHRDSPIVLSALSINQNIPPRH